ncbi:MAG: hypothetical protein IKJ35_05205 [Clostridia bacterium]|nr:hypothetical protein [Clostridia bacterium]
MGGKMLICNDILGTFFKKYKCADCKVKINRKKLSKIINTKSEEAKNYSFHIHSHAMTGDVKIYWYEFECPVCKKRFTVEQLNRYRKKSCRR